VTLAPGHDGLPRTTVEAGGESALHVARLRLGPTADCVQDRRLALGLPGSCAAEQVRCGLRRASLLVVLAD
jgi:hypothetical protein